MRATVARLCTFGILTEQLLLGLRYRTISTQESDLGARYKRESARTTLVIRNEGDQDVRQAL